MHVLITGGTGFIGRSLSADLIADGHTVTVLSRAPERATDLPAGVRAERWDARTGEGWVHLAERADAIVNLAGANIAGERFFPSRWTDERKAILRDSRANAGRAVVQALEQARHKPHVVVQASGIGYYGSTGDKAISEADPPGDDFLAKLASDDWEPSTAPVEAMGVRRVITRSGAVLDPNEGALMRVLLPFRFFVGGPVGGGKQWVPWIHREDEVKAIRFLMENEEARGAFNLVAPTPVRNAAFVKAIGLAMGRPAVVPVPGFAMKLAFGEVSRVLLDGQRAVPERLLDLGFRFRFAEVEGALQDLLG